MNESGTLRQWVFFVIGAAVAMTLALIPGVIVPLLLIPRLSHWALIPFIFGGGIILLLYYVYVVFAFSWVYEQFTKAKPGYWVSSIYLFLLALFLNTLLATQYDFLNEHPFSYWYSTKGMVMICCCIPAWIRIVLVTLIGAFYTKLK